MVPNIWKNFLLFYLDFPMLPLYLILYYKKTKTGLHFFAIDTSLGKIYWTESNKIKSANLDNSGHTEVISGLSNSLRGIAIYYNPLSNSSSSENEIPDGFYLAQNYPNPFNPTTAIEFYLPSTEFVTLKIHNILGEEVATLVSEKLTAGKYKYDWDASQNPTGIYLYKLSASKFSEVKKMLLVK